MEKGYEEFLSEETENEKKNEIVIEIGMKPYVIDFAKMIQFDAENPFKKRKIKREIETKSTLQRSESLKGCAGKFFNNNSTETVAKNAKNDE